MLDQLGNLGDFLSGLTLPIAAVALWWQRKQHSSEQLTADQDRSSQQRLAIASSIRERLDALLEESTKFSESPYYQQCRTQAWSLLQKCARDDEFRRKIITFGNPQIHGYVEGSFNYINEHNQEVSTNNVFWNTSSYRLDDLISYFVSIGNRCRLLVNDIDHYVSLSDTRSVHTKHFGVGLPGSDSHIAKSHEVLRGLQLYWDNWGPALTWILLLREESDSKQVQFETFPVHWRPAFETLYSIFRSNEHRLGSPKIPNLLEVESGFVFNELKNGKTFWEESLKHEGTLLKSLIVTNLHHASVDNSTIASSNNFVDQDSIVPTSLFASQFQGYPYIFTPTDL